MFFALWPDAHTRDDIYKAAQALKDQSGGRLLTIENLHLTLAFIGSVDSEQQQCMERVAGQIDTSPFSITLTEQGYWPKPKVAWLAPKHIPDGLVQLARDLSVNLQSCGYQAEQRQYQPHVTLLRKATHPLQDTLVTDIQWSVDSFVLVESITYPEGVEYHVLNEWPLT